MKKIDVYDVNKYTIEKLSEKLDTTEAEVIYRFIEYVAFENGIGFDEKLVEGLAEALSR